MSQIIHRGGALDRMVRLVPIEMISLYAAASAAVAELSRGRQLASLLLLVTGVAFTPIVLHLHGRRLGERATSAQHLVRVLSFIAWAFVVTNPLAPAAPIAAWMPAVSILLIPALGSLLFPPSELA